MDETIYVEIRRQIAETCSGVKEWFVCTSGHRGILSCMDWFGGSADVGDGRYTGKKTRTIYWFRGYYLWQYWHRKISATKMANVFCWRRRAAASRQINLTWKGTGAGWIGIGGDERSGEAGKGQRKELSLYSCTKNIGKTHELLFILYNLTKYDKMTVIINARIFDEKNLWLAS